MTSLEDMQRKELERLRTRFPHPQDPRRDGRDFFGQKPEERNAQLLSAILDSLYRIESAISRREMEG